MMLTAAARPIVCCTLRTTRGGKPMGIVGPAFTIGQRLQDLGAWRETGCDLHEISRDVASDQVRVCAGRGLGARRVDLRQPLCWDTRSDGYQVDGDTVVLDVRRHDLADSTTPISNLRPPA